MSASSMDGSESVDRAALAGMLKGYDADQLVEEVLSAWDELSSKNGEIATVKQRNRVLELDLAEREDLGAPEKARLGRLEEDNRDKEAKIIHLERMLEDSRGENEALSTSVDKTRMEGMEGENSRFLHSVKNKVMSLLRWKGRSISSLMHWRRLRKRA